MEGKIGVVRTIGGRRRIPEGGIKRIFGDERGKSCFRYARVSSSTQKNYLERQLIANYAKAKGYGEVPIISDVGSGVTRK